MQRQKSPSKWNETDLDMSYERKPHHTYDSWLISASVSVSFFNFKFLCEVVDLVLGQTIKKVDLGNIELSSVWSLFFFNATLSCCRDRVAAAICAKQRLERIQPRRPSSRLKPQKGGWC